MIDAVTDSQRAERWQCRVCGYIYDPTLHGGTTFEQLSDDWLCPGCGFGKEVFFRLPRVNRSDIGNKE